MADIKYARAKETRINDVPYNDGQVIVTDGGGMYIDFPHNERIKIGNDAISTNLLSLLPPENLQVEYSTQGTGLRCAILDNASANLATKYYTQGVSTSWTHERIAFTTKGSSKTLDIQLRKAEDSATYIPGDYAFDNFCILSSSGEVVTALENLIVNGSFENGSAGWVVDGRYVAQWSIVDRDGSSLQCLECNPASKYAVLLSQTFAVEPNTTYCLQFEGRGGSSGAQARISAYHNEGETRLNSLYYWNPTVGEWGTYNTTFTTLEDTTSIKLCVSAFNNVLYDNIQLFACAPYIENGDFSNGTTGWITEETQSAYVPFSLETEGTNTYIRTNCSGIDATHTDSRFIRVKNLWVQPNTQYYLEFDIKRLSGGDAIWQDYMTLTDNDKFALMSDNAALTNEFPKFGGPWATALHYNYILRCIIEKPVDMHFDLSHVGVLTSIISSQGSEVIIETSKDKTNWDLLISQCFEENILKANSVPDSFKLISCNGLRDGDFKFLRITITFQGNDALVTETLQPTKNFLKGIRLYGKTFNTTPAQLLPFKQDVFANAYFDNKIIASQLISTIDDGNIGWEDLT